MALACFHSSRQEGETKKADEMVGFFTNISLTAQICPNSYILFPFKILVVVVVVVECIYQIFFCLVPVVFNPNTTVVPVLNHRMKYLSNRPHFLLVSRCNNKHGIMHKILFFQHPKCLYYTTGF